MTAKHLGPCQWEVDDKECGKPAVTTVPIQDRAGKAHVRVCAEHKAERNRRAASLRVGK